MRPIEIAASFLLVAWMLTAPAAALIWLNSKPPCVEPCGVDLHAVARSTVVTTLGAPVLAGFLGR